MGAETVATGAIADREGLARRARRRGAARRVLIGIAGPPGSGKSTLAGALAEDLGEQAVVVALDGFHLAQVQLESLGRDDRKGAPDTFDVEGFVELLERIRRRPAETVYAPAFRRDLEEPVAGSIAIRFEHHIVLVEGNYLLLDELPWAKVASLLDEIWYLEPDDGTRLDRLRARHEHFGRSPDEARRWVNSVDEPNARLVRAARGRADLVLH